MFWEERWTENGASFFSVGLTPNSALGTNTQEGIRKTKYIFLFIVDLKKAGKRILKKFLEILPPSSVSSNFWEVLIFGEYSEEKNSCAAGKPGRVGGDSKPGGSVWSRDEAAERFGYFSF